MKKPLLRFVTALIIVFNCLLTITPAALAAETWTVSNNTGGLSTGSLVCYKYDYAVYSFRLKPNAATTMQTVYIRRNSSADMTTLIGNVRLYSSTSSTYNASNPGTLLSTGIVSSSVITFSNCNDAFTSNQTKYYYVVVDDIYNGTSSQLALCMIYGQSSFVTSNAGTVSTISVYGHTYNMTTPVAPTVASLTGGVTATSTLTGAQTDIPVFGFSVNATGYIKFDQFTINSNNSALSTYFTDFKLMVSTSSTYSAATSTQVGTTTTAGTGNSYVTFSGLSETFKNNSGQTNYYFVVASYTGTGALPSSIQFNFTSGQSPAALTQSYPTVTTYNTFAFSGNTYTFNYASLIVTGLTGGTTSGSITALQSDVVLFGFSVTASTTISVSNFNINSTITGGGSNTAQTLFDTGILYRCNGTNYNTASSKVAVGTVIFNGNYANVTFTTPESITNSSTDQNYFLVANNIGAASSATIAFNFATGQSTDAIVQTNPASSYNTFSATGNTISLPSPTIIYASNTTGYTPQTTLVAGQTAVLTAFDAKAVGNITITSPYIDLAMNAASPSGLFSAMSVWVSTTGSYADATKVSTAYTNAGSGIRLTLPSTLNLTSGTTYSYYIVGTVKSSSALPATSTVVSAGIKSNNGGNSYASNQSAASITFTTASVTITGNNSAAAGITQGALTYGQKNIVLFSFKMAALGAFTMSKLNIPSSNDMQQVFNNGKVYRSTTPYFTDASQITGASVAFSTSCAITNFNQVFNAASTTTYYYFIVADFNVGTNFTATSVQYNFSASQSPIAINTGSGNGDTFNGFTTTDGVDFPIATVINWIGSSSSDFNNPANYKTIKGSTISNIPSNIVIEIGGITTYTRAPEITSDITVGGITFGTGQGTSPSMTIDAGKKLTLNGGTLQVMNGATATISCTTPGSTASIVTPSGTSSAITGSSTLNLSGIALSNAGTFTVSANSSLNLTNNATIANTGNFTLQADANGSASVGALSGSSAFTGSYNVQQYVRGKASLNYRGYRLMSSPVSDATQTGYYSLAYLKGSGSYLTGPYGATNGFDVNGVSTLYLYRQDTTASTNYRAITNINNANLYEITTIDSDTPLPLPVGNGYLYFFRGNNSTSTTALPNDVVLTATGHLNQGPVTVKGWFYPISSASFQDATSLSYTSTSSTTVRGFNLVGNPYASTIDWNKAFDGSGGITASGISSIIYIYNPYTKTYATYDGSTGDTKDNGSRYIPSGQGFFVVATGSGAKLTFNETAKVNNQPGTFMLNSTPGMQVVKTLHVKLVKDSVQQEETLLSFNNRFSNNYVDDEDALYLKGYSNISFSSQSTDKKLLAINHLPFPKTSQSIAMKVAVAQTGNYQLHFAQQDNIPAAYDIWLKDAFLKDSLDIRGNSIYNFNVSADTNSTGAGRFSVVIRLNAKKVVHLLSFNATKSTNEVKVNWTTENEANYTTYILERSTDGGKTFKVIDSLTSAALGSYNDLDPSPVLGDNYYRLKQVDVAGNISYSNVVKVMYANAVNTILANSNISVYPNPAHSTINLTVTNAGNKNTVTSGSYKITITNSLGLLIKTETSASANWQGQIDNLLPGTYFVQVINTKDNTLTGKSTFIKL